MATLCMPRMVWAVVMTIGLMAGLVYAEDHAYNFNDEVKKGEERAGFTLKVLVKEPTYTVGAVAVKDEIKAHIHKDGDHDLHRQRAGEHDPRLADDRSEARHGRPHPERRGAFDQGAGVS